MALTKIKNPDLYSLSNNTIPIIYSSNNSATQGFRFKVDILNSSTIISTNYVYPDSTNNRYLIDDLSIILTNYVTIDNNYNAYEITYCPNNSYQYSYNVTEMIYDVSGSTTGYTNLYVLRGVKQYDETFNYADYICSSTNKDGKFLSKWQGNRKSTLSDKFNNPTDTAGNYFTINALHNGSPLEWTRVKITCVEAGGTNVYYQYLSYVSKGVYSIPAGVANLNLAGLNEKLYNSSGSLVSDEIITSATLYYTIELQYEDTSYVTCSEVIRFDIDHDCYKYAGVEFLWLGELSTFENFIFTGVDLKYHKMKRNTYKKQLNRYISGNYTYNLGDRVYVLNNLVSNVNNKAVSGWIDDNESYNLVELFNSQEVYIIQNNVIYPIIIEDSSFEEKNIKTNKLFNYEVNYSLAYDKNVNL